MKATTTATNSYVYDAWNLIRKISHTPTPPYSQTDSHIWGLDLSPSMQSADGVDDLLAESVGGTISVSPAVYAYDANAKATDLVDTNGSSVAHYEYDAFGETTTLNRTLAEVTPFRCSTKYLDAEADLCFYGYRYLNPELGRWPSRDPLGDAAFSVVNRRALRRHVDDYIFVHNAPLTRVDYLGLEDVDPCSLPGMNPNKNEGGVVCYKGKAYACVWLPPTARDWYVECIKRHEDIHVNDPDTIPCDCTKTHRQKITDKKRNEVECRAYTEHLDCLREKMTQASCDPDTGPETPECSAYYTAFREVRDRGKSEYKCVGGDFNQKLPDENK